MKAKYDISGMNCAACSAAVERAMRKLGVDEVFVNLLSGVMEVDFDESKISDIDIKKAVKNAKSASEKRKLLKETAAKNEKTLFLRLISSCIIMLILMYFSMGHMFGLTSFITSPMCLALIQLALTIPVLIINKAYFTGGIKHLFSGSPNMDSLIAVGSLAAVIYGIFAIVRISLGDTHYVHDLYFETAAMIPTLVTVGKYLEGKSRSGTGKALDMLIDLTPKTATVIFGGKETETDIDKLKKDDIVLIRPGQSIPCDGTVISGESYIDESGLTGESIPVYKSAGDKICAGTVNTSGAITARADKVGDDTVISGVVHLVEKASGSKAPISRLADKISGIFVPVVIGIAVLTFIIWMLSGAGFEFSFSRAICVLVISCPCALGLATPVAVTVGTGIAAQNGILIKSAEILEELGRIGTVLFDKTGTLTKGSPSVTDIIPKNDLCENEFLTLCASVEKKSEHPLGRAVTSFAEMRNLTLYEASSFEAISGLGLRAVMNGAEFFGGNLKLLETCGITVDSNVKELYNKLCSQGKTPLFFAKGTEYLGCIAVADEPKEDSAKAVKKLSDMGIECVMLTGDNEITAKAVADKIGISKIHAFVTPQGKEEYVRKYMESTKVAMCGDGINDSPSLARANVGISVSKGTDIAIETSDVILMNSDVYSLPCAVMLSRKTISNIKMSLFWALIYNAIGIPVAAGVLYPMFGIVLNPMIGAAAMSLSSICVVLNALRLRKIRFD